MQMTMWAILGATVGLAALVSHEKRRMLRVELGPAMVENDLSVRLPAGWQPSASTGQGSLVVVEAKEPAEQSGRVLTIFRQRTAVLLSPLEYLLQSGLLPPAYLAPRLSAAGKLVSPDPAQVAEAPGILLGYSRRVRRPDGYLELKELYACAVLPSRQAVIVRLEGVGRPAPADEQLVRQVAESIRIERPLVPERVDEIDLHGGMRLKPPNGFLLVPEKDPNRIDRHLLRDASAGSWGTIDLVPCVFFLDERPESVRAMLSLRGTDWQKATVKEDGPRRWRIDKPAGVEAAFPSRAYLLVNTDGQALLVVMHGGYQDDGWFDAAWQEIADGVGFTASARLAALLKAGAEEAQRLEDQGLAKLLGNDREEQWWLLYSETPTHHIGWTHLWYDKQGAWSAVRETRRHDPGEAITRVIQEWDGSADLGRYGAVMAYSASSGEADEPFVAKYKPGDGPGGWDAHHPRRRAGRSRRHSSMCPEVGFRCSLGSFGREA